ncbi:MAG: peptidoglycan D,D-transpeptidase FtsI family protein [Bacilli bacterium]
MFFKKIHKRIKIVLLIILFCFLLIICKVFYIQVIDYQKLNKLANALWSRNLPIESERGKIITSDGTVIADNLTTTSLVLIPNQIKDDMKEKVATDLAQILNVSYEEMYKHVSKKTSIERVHPEGRRLDYDIADKINALNYDGVYLVKEAKRYYKYANFLSHCLGYVGIDNQGLSGLELTYDEYLTGESGAIKYYSDAKGQRLSLSEVYVKPQNGMDMELTIDYNIQTSIERELDNIVTKYNAEHALILAMDPNSGAILGMGSRPDFDPNNYQQYSIEEINRNLPIWMTYEPGSTFKNVAPLFSNFILKL